MAQSKAKVLSIALRPWPFLALPPCLSQLGLLAAFSNSGGTFLPWGHSLPSAQNILSRESQHILLPYLLDSSFSCHHSFEQQTPSLPSCFSSMFRFPHHNSWMLMSYIILLFAFSLECKLVGTGILLYLLSEWRCSLQSRGSVQPGSYGCFPTSAAVDDVHLPNSASSRKAEETVNAGTDVYSLTSCIYKPWMREL